MSKRSSRLVIRFTHKTLTKEKLVESLNKVEEKNWEWQPVGPAQFDLAVSSTKEFEKFCDVVKEETGADPIWTHYYGASGLGMQTV